LNSTLKSLLFWMVLVVVGVLIWNFSANFQQRDSVISFSDFMEKVNGGQVASVTITGSEVTGIYKSPNETFRTYAPAQYEGLANKLIEKGVQVTAKEPSVSPWSTIFYSWAATRRCRSGRARPSCRRARRRR
jgi:cell division protease FtsH